VIASLSIEKKKNFEPNPNLRAWDLDSMIYTVSCTWSEFTVFMSLRYTIKPSVSELSSSCSTSNTSLFFLAS
jgi:hypothetical protein